MTKALNTEWLVDQIEGTAEVCREEGWDVEIDHGLPTVAIKNQDGETEWFFQGHEAQELLDNVPEDVSEEDYILWSSQGW